MTPRRLEKIQAEGGDIRSLCACARRTSERYYLVHSESGFSHDYLIKRYIQYVGRSLKVNDLFCRDAYRISKKREAARYEAQEAGRNLTDAFLQMRAGVSEVEAEEVTFSLDEQNLLPTTFSERLSVRISYSWRIDQNADWQFGNIIFSYLAKEEPGYFSGVPTQKISAARQVQEKKENLYRICEHLKAISKESVHKYLKEGRDGSLMPKTFMVKNLNNFGANFWDLTVT